MKKKLISTLLCVTMTLGMLAGCGNSDSSNKSDSVKEEATESASGLEPVTLHFIFFGDKKSAVDQVWDAIADYTRDTLNCDFDIQFIPADDYKNKLLVKAATGESWDLNFDADWTGYYQMAQKDAYMNLDDLLPEYAPDLYSKYEEAGMLDSIKNKGHIGVLPWTITMNNRPFFQWRGDLAEAAGITVDKDNLNTLEDVDKLLHELQEAYPDKYLMETGKVNENLFGGWMQVNADMGLFINLSDPECKVVAAEDIPEYVECAKYSEKWQDEGIIRKDILTDKLDGNSLINQGKLICKFGTHEFANSSRAWEEEGAYWDYTEVYADYPYANRTPLANTVCIPATSENPERTLMFLNMLETDQKLYDMVQYGIEGVTYELNGEEAAYPEGMDSSNSNYMEWGGNWALWKPQYMRPTSAYPDRFWEKEAEYAASSEMNVVSPLEGFSFDATNVTTEVAQRNQIFNDANKLLMAGLSGGYEDAIAKLKTDSEAIGMQKIMDEYQKQVDEFLASK